MKEKGNEGYNNKGKSVLELLNFAARAEVARRSRSENRLLVLILSCTALKMLDKN